MRWELALTDCVVLFWSLFTNLFFRSLFLTRAMFWLFNRITFGISRFLAHGPCIAWAANVVPLFVTLSKHSLSLDIPFRSEIYISQGISAVLVSTLIPRCYTSAINNNKSIVLPIWMTSSGIFILASGSLKGKGHWVILYCLIDWGMIGLMILSLVLQSWYLPSTLKGCNGANTWQLIGKDTSLFCQLGKETYRNPVDMCKQLMLVWVLNICTV